MKAKIGQGSNKPEGYLRKVTDATGKELVKEALYDQYAQVWKVKDGLDRVSEYTFDGDGDLTMAKRPDGTQTTAAYDVYGNATSVTGPDSQTTTLEYDGMGRFVRSVAPGSAATEVGLDGEGNVSWARDALGKQWDLAYDGDGNLLSRLSPRIDPVTLLRYEETYTYDARGLLTRVTDANGHERDYVRAPRGELWKVLHEDQRHADPAKHAYEVWQRFATGQVYRHRVPLSRDPGTGAVDYTYIAYTLDTAGRTIHVDNPSPELDSTLSYDDDGRLASAVGPDGTSTWTRDLAGRTTQLVQPGGTLTYAYDAAGRLDTLLQAGRGTFDWDYDAYGRVSQLTDPEGKVTALEYDTAGRPWRRTLGNGLKEERGWDTRGRLSSFALKTAAGSALRTEGWGYSSRSDVLSHTVDGSATVYTYDDEGQLMSESRTGYATSYTYDGNGNRKTRVVNGATETYTYDDDGGGKLERIDYSGGGSRTFEYDLAGRMKTDSLNSRVLSWTADSRLSSITASTGNESYTYSAFGTRAKVGTRTFLRAGAGVTASVLDDGNAKYTPGVSENRSGTTTYSSSGLKHMGAQSSSAGSVAATNTYDAFGGVVGSTGTWQGPFGSAGGFGYQTEGSGLHLLGHRYYDGSLGRFVSRDPIGDGSNWYVYCAQSPINTVDPGGLRWVYEQDDGGLYYDPPIGFVVPNMPAPSPIYVGDGFSGKRGRWRDNPDADHIKNHGPAPRGTYWLEPPREFKSDGRTRLPFNIPMTPDDNNDMKGRSHFLLHDGREELDPSAGCIILPRPIRERIWESGDREFLVVRDRAAVSRIKRRYW